MTAREYNPVMTLRLCRYLGILIIVFILACEFYLSVAPFGEKGSVKTFFANYLGAPLFFFDLVVYKVSSSDSNPAHNCEILLLMSASSGIGPNS